MKPSLHTKLQQLAARLQEIDVTLQGEDATRDMDRYRALTRERAEIEPVVNRFREYAAAGADVATAEDMARDPEMRAFAEDERKEALARMQGLEANLERMLLPKDPNDD